MYSLYFQLEKVDFYCHVSLPLRVCPLPVLDVRWLRAGLEA